MDAITWLSLLLLLTLLVIALVMASQCGGGWQYLAAILDPWVYIVLRVAVPC
jgi:hypothetical protein